jgi:LmbE family N-acetylglucosaminyl deacetylase
MRPAWINLVVDALGINRLQPPTCCHLPDGNRLLVAAPHPDDESIGCGGLIAKWLAEGRLARVVFLTDGVRGSRGVRALPAGRHRDELERELSVRRRREANAALTELGRASSEFLQLPDGALAHHQNVAADKLRHSLNRFAPDVVAIPHPTDRHVDHVAVTPILLSALAQAQLRRMPTILAYEIWSPLQANLVIDISELMDRKSAAIRFYESQLAERDYIAAAQSLNRYRAISSLSDGTFAEAYWRGTYNDLKRAWAQLTA